MTLHGHGGVVERVAVLPEVVSIERGNLHEVNEKSLVEYWARFVVVASDNRV